MRTPAWLICRSFSGKSERRQPLAIRPKSVGFDDLRARPQIFLVHVADQSRQRKVQFVITAVEENALGVKRRAHGPVGHQHTIEQRLLEFGAPILHNGHTHISASTIPRSSMPLRKQRRAPAAAGLDQVHHALPAPQ